MFSSNEDATPLLSILQAGGERAAEADHARSAQRGAGGGGKGGGWGAHLKFLSTSGCSTPHLGEEKSSKTRLCVCFQKELSYE